MKSVFLFSLALLIACHQEKSDKTISLENISQEDAESLAESDGSLETQEIIIDGTIGVLTYDTEISQAIEVSFFNDDGTVWDGLENNFKPFSWHPDFGTLALRCKGVRNDTCKIIVNEDRQIIKNYSLRNRGLVFQTWQEHILSVFSVDFDEASNPLLKSASEEAEELFYNKDEFFLPCQIKGEWLQVKWDSDGDWEYGWIKWKEGEKLLIELFYFA